MPAPARQTPYSTQTLAINPTKGIVGYYSDVEIDALLAALPAGGGDSVITVHEGQIPQPAGPVPQALEDAFDGYADGLHFFKEVGALVAITRQALQTTIVTNGASRSVAKIVKSSAGLPTPQNPSILVQQEADGKWMKLTSDELNKPFGPPQMVDIFALTGGDGVVDVLGAIRDQFIQPKGINVGEGGIAFQDIYSFSVQNVGIGPRPVIEYRDGAQAKTLVGLTRDDAYTKPEVDNLLDSKTGLQDFWQFQSLFGSYESASDEKFRLLDQGLGFANTALKNLYTKPEVDAKIDAIGAGAGASIDIVSENLSNGLIRVAALESGKADKADTYNKKEVDDKLEADKDFSIANDNVLLASITSLQEVVNNLGELGTGQIDVLAAIKGVEIEPSSVKLTGDAASPIAWKGGLSLAPVKTGSDWRLGWTDGTNTHTLLHADEVTSESIVAGLSGQDLFISNLYLEGTAITFGGPGGPAIALTDSGVVWAPDSNNPNDLRKLVTADELPKPVDLSAYAKKVDKDQNIVANGIVAKGYTFGDAISGSNPGLVYTDTGEGYGPRLAFDTPGGLELIPYRSDFEPIKARMDALEGKQAPAVDLSGMAPKADLTLLQGQVQVIFDSVYTREEADARYAAKAAYVTTTAMNAVTSLMATRTYVDGAIDFQAKRLDATITETGVLAGEITALKAAAPTAAANINDPALAAFKQSVLDEVKKMMAGGKTIPADVPWTKLLNTGSTVAEAKVLNGVVYLRGVVTKSVAAGYVANCFQLPATIPPPPAEMVIPLACKNTSPAGRYYGYATVQVNRQIGVSCDNALNTVWLDGISYPAYD